jgi:hypothetical protein
VGYTTVDDPSQWSGSTSDDEEFNATSSSLPSGWSWMNQGPATNDEKRGWGGLLVVGNGSYNTRGIYKAEPSASSYEAVFKLAWAIVGVGGSPSAQCGVFLRHSGSGKLVQYAIYSSNNLGIETANSATSYSGNTGLATTPYQPFGQMFMRIKKNSATSYNFGISGDGVHFVDTSSTYNPQTFFGGAVTDIGFHLNSTNTGLNGTIACEYLRVR